MYNEKLEALISAALADGALTEKEKQVLFKNAESMGIDLDEFEVVLDARLVEIKKKEARENQQYLLEMEKAKAAQTSAPKSDKYGDVRKCPACGAIVPSMAAVCPECGQEFTNIKANSTANMLLLKIDEIQAQSSVAQRGLNAKDAKTAERETEAIESQVEKRTVQAIKNFPIPNTREDLIEFMTLCISNSRVDDMYVNDIEEAWREKFEQLITKARITIPNDPIAEDLIKKYKSKREAVEKEFAAKKAKREKEWKEERERDKIESKKKNRKRLIIIIIGIIIWILWKKFGL